MKCQSVLFLLIGFDFYVSKTLCFSLQQFENNNNNLNLNLNRLTGENFPSSFSVPITSEPKPMRIPVLEKKSDTVSLARAGDRDSQQPYAVDEKSSASNNGSNGGLGKLLATQPIVKPNNQTVHNHNSTRNLTVAVTTGGKTEKSPDKESNDTDVYEQKENQKVKLDKDEGGEKEEEEDEAEDSKYKEDEDEDEKKSSKYKDKVEDEEEEGPEGDEDEDEEDDDEEDDDEYEDLLAEFEEYDNKNSKGHAHGHHDHSSDHKHKHDHGHGHSHSHSHDHKEHHHSEYSPHASYSGSSYRHPQHEHEHEMSHAPLPPPPPPPPPAPVPIKGSVDYVLIPMILIGLFCPIFTFMFVLLGCIETKMPLPTLRSITLEDQQPKRESLLGDDDSDESFFSFIQNAVEYVYDRQNECLERVACEGGSFYSRHHGNNLIYDFSQFSGMSKSLRSRLQYLPESFTRPIRAFRWAAARNVEANCNVFNCQFKLL